MKKNLFLILLALISSLSLSYGQSNLRSDYEEAIDYINCRFAKLSLSDQTRQPHYDSFLSQVDNGNCNYYDLFTFLNTRKNPSLENNLYLCNQINDYKKNYRSDRTHRELYMELSTRLFNESFVQEFASKSKRAQTYPVMERDIKNYLKEVFLNQKEDDIVERSQPEEYDMTTTSTTDAAQQTGTRRIDDSQTLPEPEPEPEYTEVSTDNHIDPDYNRATEPNFNSNRQPNQFAEKNQQSWLSSTMMRWSLLMLACLFLFWRGYLWWKNRSEPSSQPRIYQPPTATGDNDIAEIKEETNYLKATISSQEREINELQETVKHLEDEIDEVKEEFEEEEEEPSARGVEAVVVPPMSGGSIFYMPAPHLDGYFDNRKMNRTFDEGEAVYRMQLLDTSGKHASFEIVSNYKTIQQAMNRYDDYILPVCETTNALTQASTSLVTEKDGLVFLEDNKWKVVRKAAIRFED